jgi:hypothetical protein
MLHVEKGRRPSILGSPRKCPYELALTTMSRDGHGNHAQPVGLLEVGTVAWSFLERYPLHCLKIDFLSLHLCSFLPFA